MTEAVNMIRGEAGTTVDLTIVRQGAGDYLHVTVERAKVESPTVKYEMLDDNMAYIQIVEFDDVTIDQFTDALAGAIQDYGVGTLVGTTTFGKGIVQQIMPFTDGSAIKITISAYYTPNGRNIHGTGIEPDVECEFDGEAYYNSDDPVDNQLEKAKEVLKELMK